MKNVVWIRSKPDICHADHPGGRLAGPSQSDQGSLHAVRRLVSKRVNSGKTRPGIIQDGSFTDRE